jgi:chaperonin cofactor prefoldin
MSDRALADLEQKLEHSQIRVRDLLAENRKLKENIQDLTEKAAKWRRTAEHFDMMMKAVKENLIVKGTWDRFMMSLRLTQVEEHG